MLILSWKQLEQEEYFFGSALFHHICTLIPSLLVQIPALIVSLKDDLLWCIKWRWESKHFMGALDLTVKVSNISPKTSRADLIFFFSYCGTVDEIQLHRDGVQSQAATVTFRQPYAFQTALLLNGAPILDRSVLILPQANLKDIPVE